jgi:hypothetical protein
MTAVALYALLVALWRLLLETLCADMEAGLARELRRAGAHQ